MESLRQSAILFTFSFGLYALIRPKRLAGMLSISPKNNIGVIEIRATYGGWVCGLSGFALWTLSPMLIQCIGLGWAGAGLVRLLFSILNNNYSRQNNLFIIIELIVALILLA